ERLDVERSARSVGPGRVERDLVPRLLRDRRAGLDREAAARAAGATVERHGIVDGDREARAHVELAAVAAILVRAAAAVPGDRAVQRDVAVARVDLDLAAVPVGVAAVRIDLAYGHGPQGRRDRDAAAVGRRADVEHAGDERARAGGDVDLAAERERSRGTCQEIRAHRDESAGLELDGAARRIHSGALDVDPAGERDVAAREKGRGAGRVGAEVDALARRGLEDDVTAGRGQVDFGVVGRAHGAGHDARPRLHRDR